MQILTYFRIVLHNFSDAFILLYMTLHVQNILEIASEVLVYEDICYALSQQTLAVVPEPQPIAGKSVCFHRLFWSKQSESELVLLRPSFRASETAHKHRRQLDELEKTAFKNLPSRRHHSL